MKRILIGLGLALVLAVTVAACGSDDSSSQSSDIVDTAVEAGSFTTLASLLEGAGLVDTLKGEGPFTVFAPTDDAFAALPAGTLDELGKPENADQLEAILLYHVAEGDVMSSDLSDGQEITTLQGGTLEVGITDGAVSIGTATVAQPDIEASNGVIHVVDSVLVPQS
ncbi:MAG: fasciclin domain-containing protein [Thermoleophilia bacterium]|nr:fasciclin domain-containing protein [Thermoleophilia bacterium]MDH4345712.1 fasciclin domain-containing protein [Thermoleophilia bacterium]MDH5333000.1 fasciclin domain-containing protein [Thermoleophilia bacterium]